VKSGATIITVKQDGTGDYTTIQQGILASTTGDTVLVWPGIYFENVDFLGKLITVGSLFLMTQDKTYINNTIIDGNHNGSCILMVATIDTMRINGFTIRNGKAKRGGGFFMDHCISSIKNCIIENNIARTGGGLYLWFSHTYLSGNIIRNNHAYTVGGGIFYPHEATTIYDTFNKNSIYFNTAAMGAEIGKNSYCPPAHIVVDTFTVLNPDYHFVYSYDVHNYPLNDIIIEIDHSKIEPVSFDLFVDPVNGDDSNSGTSPDYPLKTISWAYTIIESDSLSPYSIYLFPGIYSPSTNQEKLPLNGRSYVSLIGQSPENTIVDADSLSYLYHGYGLMRDYSIENITFRRGFEPMSTTKEFGGFVFQETRNLTLRNIKIINCHAPDLWSGIYSESSDRMKYINVLISGCSGMCMIMGNTIEPPGMTFYVENCIVDQNTPIPPDDDQGVPLQIVGGFSQLGYYSGKIINLQISRNSGCRYIWPGYGFGLSGIHYHVIGDIVNSTIVDNVLKADLGCAFNITDGSEVSFYNCIFYRDSLREISLGYSDGTSLPSTLNVAYSNIEGGIWEILNFYPTSTINWYAGNIDEDPMWMDTGDHPYQLTWGSPCINTGTPMYAPGMQPPYIIDQGFLYSLVTIGYDTIPLPSTDLAGNPRIKGGRIDMGAYESDSTTIIPEFGRRHEEDALQVYPNPIYENAFISLTVKQAGRLTVEVYDLQGRMVRSLMDASLAAGKMTVVWDGRDEQGAGVPLGAYLLKATLDEQAAEAVKVVKGKWR